MKSDWRQNPCATRERQGSKTEHDWNPVGLTENGARDDATVAAPEREAKITGRQWNQEESTPAQEQTPASGTENFLYEQTEILALGPARWAVRKNPLRKTVSGNWMRALSRRKMDLRRRTLRSGRNIPVEQCLATRPGLGARKWKPDTERTRSERKRATREERTHARLRGRGRRRQNEIRPKCLHAGDRKSKTESGRFPAERSRTENRTTPAARAHRTGDRDEPKFPDLAQTKREEQTVHMRCKNYLFH
jgi:hypothetical protein